VKRWFYTLLVFPLVACTLISDSGTPGNTPTPKTEAARSAKTDRTLPDLGPAPVWHNEIWLNTQQPLPLVNLRGQVVLLEMWTFG